MKASLWPGVHAARHTANVITLPITSVLITVAVFKVPKIPVRTAGTPLVLHLDPVRGRAAPTMTLLVLVSKPSTGSSERRLAPSLLHVIDLGGDKVFYVRFCSNGAVSISGHKYGHASSLLISCLARLHMPDMSTNSRPGPDLRGRRQGMPRAPQASLWIYQGKIYDRQGFQVSPGTASFGSVGRAPEGYIYKEFHTTSSTM